MVRYSKEKPLRVFTAFSGYYSQGLAGNSIVVNCMTLMFDNLLYPDTEPTTGDQLKLF